MKVTIFGMGYVGLSAVLSLAALGHEVMGVDNDRGKVELLQAGEVPLFEPGFDDMLGRLMREHRIRFSCTIPEHLGEAVLIAVGTPASSDGTADLRYVFEVVDSVVETAREPMVIIMKSTVPPGTGAALESRLKTAHTTIHYVSNPEFLRQGQALHDSLHPDRIILGASSEEGFTIAEALHRGIEAPVLRTATNTAELTKYAANAFLAMKVSFINEIANLCDRVGANVTEVARGIGLDKRIGAEFLRAGIGYGGSCFPKDTAALKAVAAENGCSLGILDAVMQANAVQRLLPAHRVKELLGDIKGKRIAVLGLAFKPSTDDTRNSPALDFIPLLVEQGASVVATDPRAIPTMKRLLPTSVRFEEDPMDCVQGADAVIIATEWADYVHLDWGRVVAQLTGLKLVFDGRNCIAASHVLDAGGVYVGVGVHAQV